MDWKSKNWKIITMMMMEVEKLLDGLNANWRENFVRANSNK